MVDVYSSGHEVEQLGLLSSELLEVAPGQLNPLHSIAADKKDRIYIAARSKHRVQVLDTERKVLKIMKIKVPAPADVPAAIGAKPAVGPNGFSDGPGRTMPGEPWAICSTPPDVNR